MSTNAYILKQEEDNSIKGVFLNFDGYLTNAGITLLNHYNTKEKIDKLLSFGAISVLKQFIEPKDGEKHDFYNPIENVCIFYHRDSTGDLLTLYFKNEEIFDKYIKKMIFLFHIFIFLKTINGFLQKIQNINLEN